MRRLLPPKGSKELENELEWYHASTEEDRARRAGELGFSNRHSYETALMRCGGSLTPTEVAPLDTQALTADEQKVLDLVRKNPTTVGNISRHIDRSSESVIKLIDSLRSKHYEVILDETRHEVAIPHTPTPEFAATDFKYFRKYYRIGVVTDTQLGSKYQQMTLLHDAYKIFDERKTDFNLLPGDVVDGVDMYKGHRDELFLYDAEQQREYVVLHFPKSARGTKTYLIGGQHDYCFMKREGYNILEHICEKRDDLIYRGFFSATFNIKELPIELQHPGGGVSYARSYRIQKIIESMQGHVIATIRAKPELAKELPVLILFGHFHVAVHLPSYMGLDAVALPCLQSQTKYLQQRGYMPDVGCAVAEIWLDENDNLSSTKIEFINMNAQIRRNDY